jgi:uncharacterized protein (TIGR03083 family)
MSKVAEGHAAGLADGVGHALARAIDAYEHTMRALLDLGQVCSDTDFDLPTECPGWTVKDQFSHIVGIERWMLGERDPEHDLPELDHVRGDFARRVEVSVDVRRSVAPRQIVAELGDVLVARLSALRAPGRSLDELVASPLGGEAPLRTVLALRTFDIWTHEQDIRRALGRPGNLDSPAAAVAVSWIRRSLPRVVARGARVAPEQSVTFDVTGPVAFCDTVQVRNGDDGKAVGVVVSGSGGGSGGSGDVPDAVARLTMDTEAFMRRTCGRWPVAETPVLVDGDDDVARRVLEAMAVTP